MKEFKWLHLTDLHVGQQSHNWLWPNLKKTFIDDLERISKNSNGLDVIIFSGDITQKGAVSEFNAFTAVLLDLYEKLDKWGYKPGFFCVPGNHDLVRPDPDLQESLLFKQWRTEPSVAKQFWKTETSPYRKHIEAAFQNYTNWKDNIGSQGIPILPTKDGKIPGDVSASAKFGDVSVGLVGLNSTFLQLGDGDYNQQLDLDVRQLLAVTDENPDEWCSQHDVNFLITHHPTGWLHPEVKKDFDTEIYPPERFTAHIFGHMHESSSQTISTGGGPSRKIVQGPSIFGLEYLADGTTERRHGYTVGKIAIQKTSAEWILWPRISHIRGDGKRNFIPDYNHAIIPGAENTSEPLKISTSTSQHNVQQLISEIEQKIVVTSINEVSINSDFLEATKYNIPQLDQHIGIRVPSQQACVAAIALERMVWICTDWGLGTDGFLYSIVKSMGYQEKPIYRIDLGNYAKRSEFLNRFPELYGCSFSEYCKNLLQVGPAILIFDEAPSENIQELHMASDVESLGDMVLDFCPQVVILAVTRVPPITGKFSKISLTPLDEVETRAYVFSHKNCQSDIKNPSSISEIYKLTGGVPSKIEKVLKSLRVVNLSDLQIGALVTRASENEVVPRALSTAIEAIFNSADDNIKRAGLMLKLLCILPHGETLQKIRRFDPQYVFYETQAVTLLDYDLIEVRNGFGVIPNVSGQESKIKLLFAKAAVREYVLSLLGEKEIDSLTKRAMGLYFEENRSSGIWKIKSREGFKISEDLTTLDNGHELVLRMLSLAVLNLQNLRVKTALTLAQIYCAELLAGKHYRSCTAACDAVLSTAGAEASNYGKEVLSIRYLLAKSSRMQGDNPRSKKLLEELIEHEWPKDLKVSLLLNYALCLQSLDDSEAIKAAEELIKISPKSNDAIQARAIVVEMGAQGDAKVKLLRLEEQAKKSGAVTVRNNLILSRADSYSDDSDMLGVLQEVVSSSSKTRDPYNASRAAVKIATISVERNIKLSNENINNLISAYQYFYGQRFDALFLKSHKALWDIFENTGDIQNLLSLFKHSSFIWRLNGNEDREKPYVTRMIKSATGLLKSNIITADHDTAYFIARAKQVKKLS
ncbi:metallophosphoesterase [Duganella levis]|uniref:Calcineurin-like phosphoesterase domain-containing protein n=1 Tax=Duganella levis TaxID=2692169 RepID=A0ABW9VXG2_9BURK|nr:metallophosphoesterase [Duganella levis]MYN26350.1 hypothetical protein [Duganella levis]